MTRIVRIEIPVDEEAAEALQDTQRLEKMGRLVSEVARLYHRTDPLAALFERTSKHAQDAGLTDDDIDAELAAYNTERRD